MKNFTLRLLVATVLTAVLSFNASAQTEEGPKSRLAVVANEAKTTIWVSDFPKSTTIVLFDEEDNLLSIVSTNEYGAAYISLPKSITTTIFAKTMNGEITVSNKTAVKKSTEENIALKAETTTATKA